MEMEELKEHGNVHPYMQKTSSAELQTNEQWDEVFWIRGNEETGYFATLGSYQITTKMETRNEVADELNQPSASTVIAICIAQSESREEYKKLTENGQIPTTNTNNKRQDGEYPNGMENDR